MLGGLSEDAILDEFAKCDVVALPSVQETTPMVIAQAMAAASLWSPLRSAALPKWCKTEVTGYLVPVGDSTRLAAALTRLDPRPIVEEPHGQAGKQFAIRNYLGASVARRTCEVYSRIASGN